MSDAVEVKHAIGRWMVFNIGCIECGVSSDVVGIFADEDEAKAVAGICQDELSWRVGGH